MTIRKIRPEDNVQVANIIRTVMPEFGASGQGFAIHDKEVDNMYTTYTQPRSAYFVCEENGKLVGGGGVAPLEGGDADTCELKKMYFLPQGRGKGWGQHVLEACLKAATEIGFTFCYLETFNTMKGAMKLYEKNGFEKIPKPCGNTGHFACDTFYKKKLQLA
ncbi:MAG: GNAT family N-acetyltransferase [Cyclobacteriaceae bacterium]|nr:GNAT family N-acetyltransferase [Cyclobacteriaceae bacterium]MBX2955759.1 GNAT family N-acetyltransferase [Cyclobacteriaceae bacterium]